MQTHKQTHPLATWYQRLNQTDASEYSEAIPEVYLGLCQISEMTPFMSTVECIIPPMCGSHRWIIHTQVHCWISYIRAVHYVFGTPFQISDNAYDIRNLFMRLGLAVMQKHLTDDYCWIFLRDGFVLRVWRGRGCPPVLTSFLFDTIIL